MTVFVVQRATYREGGVLKDKYDLSPAEEFGELVELLDADTRPFNLEPVIDALYSRLEDFGDDDYMICIGNPILLSLAVSIALDINDGRVQLLQWNGRRGTYVPVSADLGFTDAD